MPNTATYDLLWDDEEVRIGVPRAVALGFIRAANQGVMTAKSTAIVVSGTYQRSIHSAISGYDGSGDFQAAGHGTPSGDDLQQTAGLDESDVDNLGEGIMMGSWVPYADKLEASTGNILSAAEAAMAVVEQLVEEAMSEAGLA